MDVSDVCGRKMADGGIIRAKTEKALNGRNYGRMAKLLYPQASFIYRGHPRFVRTEDGSGEIIMEKKEKP